MPAPAFAPLLRIASVLLGVLAAHVVAIWLLQTARPVPAPETVVPAQILAEWVRPPAPKQPQTAPISTRQAAASQPQPPLPAPKQRHLAEAPPDPRLNPPAVPPAPPVQLPATTPVARDVIAPATPTAQSTAPASPVVAIAPVAPPAERSPQPAPPRIEQPSTQADYLNNPKPAYPALSRRLGEEGQVVVRVLIEADGSASKAEIATSSGYKRLDQTALETVLRWRYVPGKRNGTPEPMWFNVPIPFVLTPQE